MSPSSETEIAEALNRLWVQFLPQLEERVAVLETAAATLAERPLDATLRERTRSAAHNLAGTLGTFGLAEGTTLAREVEGVCSNELPKDAARAERLREIAIQLREMLDSRK